MNVVLTGATGFLGYRTLERLVELQEVSSITAVGRTIKPTHHIKHEKVNYVMGDLSNAHFVNEVVKGADVIIHAAALSSPWGKTADFKNANVVSQQHLIQAAKEYGVKKYIYISTPSLYFELKDKLNIKESDQLPKKFINAYAATKREAEILLQSSGIPFVGLRPRALIGRGDTVIMPRLIRAFDEGKLKVIGNGKNIVDLTSVANVVDAILLGLKAEGNALNQLYNISNGEPVLLWEKVDLVLSKLGKTLPTKKVPFWLVKKVAGFMEFKSRITNQEEPALTVYGVGTLTKSFTMDITKAKTLLGYVPRVSTDEAVEEFVNWYKTTQA
ncbi:MAG TPA: NAD-dependent epimerase/dehydratase family protein [Flavobacteriales bacterium]|nr:NAD-dependent epimerase/dehydratase family protein [Flavobacteriales bacterium]